MVLDDMMANGCQLSAEEFGGRILRGLTVYIGARKGGEDLETYRRISETGKRVCRVTFGRKILFRWGVAALPRQARP
jgi:hypothetical protein